MDDSESKDPYGLARDGKVANGGQKRRQKGYQQQVQTRKVSQPSEFDSATLSRADLPAPPTEQPGQSSAASTSPSAVRRAEQSRLDVVTAKHPQPGTLDKSAREANDISPLTASPAGNNTASSLNATEHRGDAIKDTAVPFVEPLTLSSPLPVEVVGAADRESVSISPESSPGILGWRDTSRTGAEVNRTIYGIRASGIEPHATMEDDDKPSDTQVQSTTTLAPTNSSMIGNSTTASHNAIQQKLAHTPTLTFLPPYYINSSNFVTAAVELSIHLAVSQPFDSEVREHRAQFCPQATYEDAKRLFVLCRLLGRLAHPRPKHEGNMLYSAGVHGYLEGSVRQPPFLKTVSPGVVRMVIDQAQSLAAEKSAQNQDTNDELAENAALEETISATKPATPIQEPADKRPERRNNVQEVRGDHRVRRRRRPDPAVQHINRLIGALLLGRRAAELAVQGIRTILGLGARGARYVVRASAGVRNYLRGNANGRRHAVVRSARGLGKNAARAQRKEQETSTAYTGYAQTVDRSESNGLMLNYRELQGEEAPLPSPDPRLPRANFFIYKDEPANAAEESRALMEIHDLQQLGHITMIKQDGMLRVIVYAPVLDYVYSGYFENISGEIFHINSVNNPLVQQGLLRLPVGAAQILHNREEQIERLRDREDVPDFLTVLQHIRDQLAASGVLQQFAERKQREAEERARVEQDRLREQEREEEEEERLFQESLRDLQEEEARLEKKRLLNEPEDLLEYRRRLRRGTKTPVKRGGKTPLRFGVHKR